MVESSGVDEKTVGHLDQKNTSHGILSQFVKFEGCLKIRVFSAKSIMHMINVYQYKYTYMYGKIKGLSFQLVF